jgi:CPA2 family monovalent cation:H+ antiporter-2
MELDLAGFLRRWRTLAVGAGGTVVLTLLGGVVMAMVLGQPFGHAVGIGACLTMSSTLFLLRALDDHRLRNREEGAITLGVSLVQDLALAPLLLLISLAIPPTVPRPAWAILTGMVVLIAATAVIRSLLASAMINRIRALQVPEIEVCFAIAVGLGGAWAAEHAGLGAASGAFCAGLALGGGEHARTLQVSVRPLLGLMAVIFFTAMGVLFDPLYVTNHLPLVLGALLVATALKAFLAGFALRLAGLSVRSSLGGGLMLANIGEFSFVLAATAFGQDPAQENLYRLIVAVTCLSLLFTPLLMAVASRFLPIPASAAITGVGDSVVVAGLGPIGNTVVTTLRDLGYPLLLVDRNPHLLESWQGQPGITTHLGRIEDMDDWLPRLGHRPALVVLTFPIPDASAVVAQRLRSLDPDLVIVARSPYQSQEGILHAAGVRHVICDERETARALLPLIIATMTNRTSDPERLRRTRQTLRDLAPPESRHEPP